MMKLGHSLKTGFLIVLSAGCIKPVPGAVVTGTVRDVGGETVSSARVSFILSADTTTGYYTLTDQLGNYRIESGKEESAVRKDKINRASCGDGFISNYPNPFNPSTNILFHIQHDKQVIVSIANVLGQTVRVLKNERMAAGEHGATWDGRDMHGRLAAPGIYICRINIDGILLSRKMILAEGAAILQSAPLLLFKPEQTAAIQKTQSVFNVVITGKGILPYSLNGVSVAGDMQLDFTVERAEAKHLMLEKSITLDGGSKEDDAAYGFIFDRNGNMYVTGFVTVTGEGRNIWLAKYDQEMNLVISQSLNGSASGEDTGYTFAMDESDHLFVIGYVTETGQDHDIWIAKYDTDLNLLKQITVNGSKNETDDGYGILYDGNGFLYTAGTVREMTGENNIWLAKYDTDLNLITSITMNRTDNMTDKARFMVLDGMGHLFVSGSVSQEISDYDIWIGKFDTDLRLLKETDVAGPVDWAEDKGYGICLDEFGILYCTGTVTGPGQGLNIWLAKYDVDLNLIKMIFRDGPLHGEDVAYLMSMDDSGYLYLTGVFTEPEGNENAWIGVYNRDLQLQNDTTVNGTADSYDSGMEVICRKDRIYVSGFLTEVSEKGNIWLARYRLVDP